MMGRPFSITGTVAHAPPLRGFLDGWLVVAVPAGVVVGLAVASGSALLVLGVLIALAALVAVVFRPEAVLLVWFLALLANGRWVTYQELGPLYVTEPLLALLTAGVVLRLLFMPEGYADLAARGRAFRFVGLVCLVLLVPAAAALLLRTSGLDYAVARNVLLVLYVLFAFIAAALANLRRSYRLWFGVAVAGPALALLLVATGNAGSAAVTSTGAIRIASHTFPLAFGIAAIVLIAAAREGLIRPVLALGAVPFLVGLILVNHRSIWLAFLAAVGILFVRRVSAPVIAGGIVTVAAAVLLFSGTVSAPVFEAELARARTVTSTTDPNARYRLDYWKAVFAESAGSPFVGAGFDAYPAELVPVTRRDFSPGDPVPDPHNSFLAIAYRVGLLPLAVLLVLLGDLVRRGYRASRTRADAHGRAVCSALTAIVVYVGVSSAFNVFLEAPYAGPLFWTAVGLLAHAVFVSGSRADGEHYAGRAASRFSPVGRTPGLLPR